MRLAASARKCSPTNQTKKICAQKNEPHTFQLTGNKQTVNAQAETDLSTRQPP